MTICDSEGAALRPAVEEGHAEYRGADFDITAGIAALVCNLFLGCEHPMIGEAGPNWVHITRWAALAGNWTFTDRIAHFNSRTMPSGYGLAVSDERFQGGLIRSAIRLEGQDGSWKDASAGIVLGYNRESGGYLVVGLGAFNFAYAIWEFIPGVAWTIRKALGDIHNLQCNRDYQLDVAQKGYRPAEPS